MNAMPSSASLCQMLKADLAAAKIPRHGLFWMALYAFTMPSFSAVLIYRLAARCAPQGKIKKQIAKFLWRLNMFVHAIDIAPKASIGEGLYLPHPIGIVIGQAVIVGKNAILYQNITLGVKHAGDPALAASYPHLGDNVTVSSGAVICGPVKIGDRAVIGANAVVLSDVPPDATAVGVPARILNQPVTGR